MQCGATALIINVAYDLLKKELKKKYILSLFIICFTFGMRFFYGYKCNVFNRY